MSPTSLKLHRARVLMITGDKNVLVPGTRAYERAQLQRAQVDDLTIVYWGRGSTKFPSAKGFDIVTVQDPFWRGLVGLIAARRAGAKLQVQVHTDFAEESRGSLLRHVVGQIVLGHAGSVRVVSQKIKEQIAKYTRAPISVLPVFIDVSQVRSAVSADRTQFGSFAKLILAVSRLEPEKHVSDMLRILAEVLTKVSNTALIIAGKGSQEQHLKALAHELGVEKNVVWLGERGDIFSIYKAVDCLLVTSKFESFGAAIVEALAAGTPVVAPDVGVAKEAGAIVVSRDQLAAQVVEVLTTGKKGTLTLPMLTKDEWAKEWRASL